jgi:endonuclease/exonuclease/phosphatase family metal-dependent hydrolase
MKIKVACLNLWLGGILMDEVIEFLRQQNADIVLLQEVYNGTDKTLDRQFRSMEVLHDALGYKYGDFVPDFLELDRVPKNAQRGNAILSRFPITARDAQYFYGEYSETFHDIIGPYDELPRNLQHIVAQTSAGEINVFNFHGIVDMDGDNYSPARQKMSQVILGAIKGKEYVILGGDTNATPGNQAIKDIEEKLASVFAGELKSTFNMRHKDNPGYATSVVDMLFVSPDVKILQHSCPNVDISDHLPLVAEFEIA